MKTLMYPIAPEDDFPGMFCAISPYSGESQFYVPERSGSVNKILSDMEKAAMDNEETIKTLRNNNVRLRIDNALLRELADNLVNVARAIADGRASDRLDELERRVCELRVKVD